MEPKVLFLLLALHTVLSATYGVNMQKKPKYISDITTMAPKMLLQQNKSEKFYNMELAKLKSGIDLYKQKIHSRQNERTKLKKNILRRMPQKCKKINCPFEEKPVCAKFFYKNRSSKPFYVRMINECEMNYMKCHRGLESTIVPMDSCHSVVDNLQAQTGKKRSKRSVQSGPPAATSKAKSSTSNLKGTSKSNTSISNKKTNLKTISSLKNIHLNQKTPIKLTKTKLKSTLNYKHAILSNKITRTASKMKSDKKVLDLKSEKANLKLVNNIKFVPQNKPNDSVNNTKLASPNKTKLKLVNNIAHTSNNKTNLKIVTVTNVKTSNKVNHKAEVVTITLKPNNGTKTKLKSKLLDNTNSKFASKVKTAPKAVSKKILKSNGKPNVDQKINAPKWLNANKKKSVRKTILRQGEDDNIVLYGESHSKNSNLLSKEVKEGGIGSDDENDKESFNAEEAEIKGENNSQQILTETEMSPSPVVEEPTVDESETFNEEEEYHYQPEEIPPIVNLDTDDKDKKNIGDETKILAPYADDNQGSIPPETVDEIENIDIDDIVVDAPGGDKNNGGDDEVDKVDYNAECPRECPARDMMVCAMCQHGVYRTFLSVCHMRMFQCQGDMEEELELVARFPCVMSAPLITEDPQMQPKGRISEPNDQDRVLRYVRCREKGLLGKNAKCTFEGNETLNMEVNETENTPFEY